MSKIKISPSVLSGEFAALGASVKKVCEWGADYVHCDVMDGVYVPNITFGMPMIKSVKPYSTLPLDVHLMIVNPEKYVEQFVACGADILSFHPDATDAAADTLKLIRSLGAKAGLAVNPDRDESLIEPFMDAVDMIIVMGVYPGFGGQKYIESVSDKIKRIAAMIAESGRDIELEVDGGVTCANAGNITSFGANVLVGGNAVFGSDKPEESIRKLRGEMQ